MNKNTILETYTMTQEEEVKWLRKCVSDLQEERDKYKEIIDKIKKYIDEEKEEYEKGQLLYKDFGRELEQYTKGQVVAYGHIEKLLKGSDNNE